MNINFSLQKQNNSFYLDRHSLIIGNEIFKLKNFQL